MKHYFRFIGILVIAVLMSFSVNNEKMLIVIDAGHGGKDNGAEVEQTTEKEIVLAISKKIKALNANSNFEIVLIRDKDENVSLSDRIEKINSLNPDLLISIHINKNDNPDINGAMVFVSPENETFEESNEMAKIILNSIPEGLSKTKVHKGNFYVLKNSNCPSVLILFGNLNNENDRRYVSSEKGQSEIATMVLSKLFQ